MKFGLKQLLLTSAIAGVLAPAAYAQNDGSNPFLRGRYTPVDERRQEEYDPVVVHAGAFDLWSSLGVDAAYNDNVFAQPNNETEDTIIRFRPQVEARSNWTVHQLVAGISLDHREYVDNDSETTTDYNAYVNGRLDATRTFQLTGAVNAASRTEERYEPASTNSPEPAQADSVGASIGALYRTDRLQFEGSIGTNEDDYQSFFNYRDVSQTILAGRASYAMSPDVAFFIQARQSENDYDQAGSVRDSTTNTLQIGTSFELSAPIRGEISIGADKDDKDSPTQPDTDGFSLDARVQWFPTQLTTVTFRGHSGISDPGVLQATSATVSNYSVRADHELMRNLLIYGEFGFGTFDFEAPTGSPFARQDDFVEFNIGGAYKLNRHAHLVFGFKSHHQETSGSAPDFDTNQNVISVGVKFFP